MGVYLSSPITEKESIVGQCERFVYGASSMQGWRITQEDAHNCIPLFDESSKTSFFAVYDGHGGPEVAKYCELYFPDFVKNLMKIQGGVGNDPKLFIKHAFLAFDATLTNEDVIKELKQLAGKGDKDHDKDDYPCGKEKASLLKEEASMPLNRLLAKYKSSTSRDNKKAHKKEAIQSPAIRPKSGSVSDAENPNLHAENGLSSSSKTSSSSSESSKEDTSSNVSSVVQNSSKMVTSKNQDSVNTDNSGSINNNNNNINKITNRATRENLISTVTDVLLPSPHNETNDTVADHSNIEKDTGEIHPAESDSSLPCEQDESNKGIVSTLNSVDGPSDQKDNSNAGVRNKTKSGVDDVDKVDGAIDDEEDEDDLWEDMSDEEEEDDEPDDAPMMDLSNEEPGSDSGCTACVLLMQGNKIVVANAGDSRCVLARAGKAVDLSFDHKPEDAIERKRIERAGGKVTADGRVNGGLNLSRAIGDHVYKRNKDLPAKEQMITALPDIETAELCDEDQFIVIACDGIWNYMSSQEVVDYVSEKLKDSEKRKNPSQICEQLFDHCLAPNTFGDGTGCDNMTCIIILLDAFIKSKAQQTVTEAADTKDSVHESDEEEDSSDHQLLNRNEMEDTGSGSLKRCADSVEVPEGKRLKVEEEVA